ncbi:MAG: nuA3 HAT complex component nto1 [Sclerophora amabilis]|nr:MAG: nuA3 HAT complex component nto1 [Sclerophora amabilis]
MAPLPSHHRRPFNSRGRSAGRPRGRPSHPSSHSRITNGNVDPPLKKRRYVPGGPGGGGRYVDLDGTETPVGGTGPGGYAYSGPRGRVGRENAANGVSPSAYPRRRDRALPQQRYSSAAAAAAAVQGDGYKPREERGWEEFHPHLDIDAKIAVFSSEEVDGVTSNTASPSAQAPTPLRDGSGPSSMANGVPGAKLTNGDDSAASPSPVLDNAPPNGDTNSASGDTPAKDASKEILFVQPPKRKVGRPMRRNELPLNGAITPSAPKVVPLPGPNPRERLTLPKPSFRPSDPFSVFEQKAAGQQRYVDRPMANVGYQESDIFERPESQLIRVAEGTMEEDLDLGPGFKSESEGNTALGGTGVGTVEYDMDEQDDKWLAAYNAYRKTSGIEPITREVFEITMTKIEKEWHALEKRIPKPNPKPPQTHRPRSSSAAAVNGEPNVAAGEEQDSKCAICDDGDCENTNAIVFCDGCDLAVHQECYGVPFIPEGQWLCRKCQLIGRGTPTCIFCPNTDGAFKQTNASRWSHLLCAIWIPEVTLGNTTFMEPVMDVEKVPKQRWKLTCYICRQRMGACIQCGNKNCFIAFHVTCARKARLFLKMKSTHGGPASLDASVLKAYCDKHVPSEWRRDNDVDAATADAQDYFHHTMRGRLWADSQQSALATMSQHKLPTANSTDNAGQPSLPRINFTVGANKRKRNQPPKSVWKLPSGAPVVPNVVYNAVESSLQRFTVLKRKEYAAEACKFWTMKREARRGAALLKRLQLQMETFSSMEITRRNFSGMGAAGRVRLKRRIDFATDLLKDVEKLRLLCSEIKKREHEKLGNAELMKEVVDTVYFPIASLLWPILKKAQSLDLKDGVFRDGFQIMQSKLQDGFYTSVSVFSTELGAVFSAGIGSEMKGVAADASAQLSNAVSADVLTPEQKDKRRLARRIIKAIQGSLEEATRKEAELGLRPFEEELKELGILLDNSVLSRRNSVNVSGPEDASDSELRDLASEIKEPEKLTNGASDPQKVDGQGNERMTVDSETNQYPTITSNEDTPGLLDQTNRETLNDDSKAIPTSAAESSELIPPPLSVHTTNEEIPSAEDLATHTPTAGPTTSTFSLPDPSNAPVHGSYTPSSPPSRYSPPPKGNLLAPLTHGGVPWYLQTFDPEGTTIHEERWTGPEVVRCMSEELSEIDDEILKGLVDEDMKDVDDEDDDGEAGGALDGDEADESKAKARKRKMGRRKWKGYK